MKKITAYIPCYISNNERFNNEVSLTVKSLGKYSTLFSKIKFFICQKTKKKFFEELIETIPFNIPYEIIYIEERNPRFLPIDVFQYIQKDKELSDDDLVFYDEANHILHIDLSFWSEIEKELNKWNVIMPHRLWKTKALKDREYPIFWEYFIWNLFPEWISNYNDKFDLMESRTRSNNTHNAYAWCYFIKKRTLYDISLKKYYWLSFYFVQILSIFHKYNIYRKIILSKKIRKHIPIWYPFWLILESPSLILSFVWKKVLKTKEVKNLYVIHLSQNAYV